MSHGLLEFVAWVVMLGIVVYATIVCTKSAIPKVDSATARYAAPLLAVAFLSTCSLVVQVLVCGCNCCGAIISKIGIGRVAFGILTCVAAIILVHSFAKPHLPALAVFCGADILLFLVVYYRYSDESPEPLLP
jgi:hypothetical protein